MSLSSSTKSLPVFGEVGPNSGDHQPHPAQSVVQVPLQLIPSLPLGLKLGLGRRQALDFGIHRFQGFVGLSA